MLEILKLKLYKENKSVIAIYKNEGNFKGITKYYYPASKEWVNSIYAYNNYYRQLPVMDNLIIKLTKAYFNMYIIKLNQKLGLTIRKNKAHYRKIWLSKPELKHTADKVFINLFIYDRNRKYLISKMKKIIYEISEINSVLNIKQNKIFMFLNNISNISKIDVVKLMLKKEMYVMFYKQIIFF